MLGPVLWWSDFNELIPIGTSVCSSYLLHGRASNPEACTCLSRYVSKLFSFDLIDDIGHNQYWVSDTVFARNDRS